MLAEFLLTPDALSGTDGHDGGDLVREMAECFFPRRAVPVALVCKLGGEAWERAASRRIAGIANANHRQIAMSLFQRLLSDLCVTRPPIQLGADNEAEWIKAGIASASHVSLNKIVVSPKSAPPPELGASLKDFISDAFWEGLGNPRLVARSAAAQEQALRAICTHSDWLLLRLPQIRGGNDDEIVTVKQIVKLSNQLPSGFRKSVIELHIPERPKLDAEKLIRGISGELSSFVRNGIQIQVSIRPEKDFVDRELLAGDFTRASSGEVIRRPRWWITMTHVAVRSRNATNAADAANTWSLFSRQKAHERYEKIKADTAGESFVVS